MQAIDTNILVFAKIRSSPHHSLARKILAELAEGSMPWAIPWPCVYEFLRVVTHPRVYHPPVPVKVALQDLRRILDSPTLILLHETAKHPEVMMSVIEEAGVSGNLVHDAHIAALCIEHGISEFVTGDQDFSRFPSLSIKNPFVRP
jgi:toxin-antitoxin system PIN domain toxin